MAPHARTRCILGIHQCTEIASRPTIPISLLSFEPSQSCPTAVPVSRENETQRDVPIEKLAALPPLGTVTQRRRDFQTAMYGSGAALFRESANLESPYAKAALRLFCSALCRSSFEVWIVKRIQDSTAFKIVHDIQAHHRA